MPNRCIPHLIKSLRRPLYAPNVSLPPAPGLQLPLPQNELLALAARLLDPSPQPLQDFLAVEVCQLAMAAAHPHHLGQLFKALAAGTAPDHPLLGVAEEYRTTVEKAAGNGGPAAALQLLPEAPAGYLEERQAVTQFLKRGLVGGVGMVGVTYGWLHGQGHKYALQR